MNSHEIRTKIIDNITRLNNNNTRDDAFSVLKTIITDNKSSSALRLLLNSLMTHFEEMRTSQSKERIVLLFGFIANVYRSDFKDPIDKSPSMLKTANRIAIFIRNYPMKESDYVIHKACSYTLIELFDICGDKKNNDALYRIFVAPFVEMLFTGSNKYARDAVGVYINDFIFHLSTIKDVEFTTTMISRLLNESNFIADICKKLNTYENEFLYESMYNIIRFFPLECLNDSIKDIIDKCVSVISKNSVTSNNPNAVVNCVNILGVLARREQAKGKIDEIVSAIKPCLSDRNRSVRKSAKDAIKVYDEIIKKNFLMNDVVDKEEFKKSMRDRVREGKVDEIEQYDSEIVEKMKKEIYNKGIGDILKLSKFIKEHSKMNMESRIGEQNIKKINKNVIKRYDLTQKMPIEYNYDNTFEQGDNNNAIQREDNLSNVIKYVDIAEIKKSFSVLDKKHAASQRVITSKIFAIESKLEKINDCIHSNRNDIIKAHNNILDDTVVSNEDIKTESSIDTSLNNSLSNDQNMYNTYLFSVSLLNEGKIEKAFDNIISNGDDIYLIRLLLLNKDIIANIPLHLFKHILLRINMISLSHFIENMMFNLIDEILRKNIIINDALTWIEISLWLKELMKHKNSNIKQKASIIYKELIKRINNK